MHHKTPMIVTFLMIMVVAMPAGAAQAFDVTQAYLQPALLPAQLLPPPPVEGSAEWRRQTDAVIHQQQNLSPAEITAIRDEQKVRPEMMASAIGPDFTREKYPKTYALLDHVLDNLRAVSETDKKYWHTRRPYLTDAKVKLYVDPIDSSPSYPSGHTTASRTMAEVLGLLMPDKLAALRARADAIARHRIEGGVHYPVDIDGGRMLAMLVVGAMVSNDYFQDDLVAARKEIENK